MTDKLPPPPMFTYKSEPMTISENLSPHLIRIAEALERVADTLDDHMDLALVGQDIGAAAMSGDPMTVINTVSVKMKAIQDRRVSREQNRDG